MRWPFKRASKLPPPPAPSSNLTLQQFKRAQDDYVDKHDKLVKPAIQIVVEAAKQSADFGKMVINYMVFGNVGGLAALTALAPLMHDTNKMWLSQQLWPALAFGVGAALGVGIAVVAHFNYASHAAYFIVKSQRDEAWLKAIEFGLGQQWHTATDAWMAQQQDRASARANITNLLSVVVFAISAGLWVYGAISLAISIQSLTLS